MPEQDAEMWPKILDFAMMIRRLVARVHKEELNMSNMKPNRSQKDAEFVKRLDALIGAPDGRDNSALDEDLRECGIDPKQLREVAYERIRSIATQKFTSLGKDCPPQMREALRQLRPPTPEEEELNRRSSQAASTVLTTMLKVARR